MTLWKKSVKIQYRFQKFLHMVDRHDITDFWIQKFFWLGPFFNIFFNLIYQKMTQAKKFVNKKNQFLHARQLPEGIFDICSNCCCIFTVSC